MALNCLSYLNEFVGCVILESEVMKQNYFPVRPRLMRDVFLKIFHQKKRIFLCYWFYLALGCSLEYVYWSNKVCKYKYGIIHHWFRNGWRQDDCIINDWNCIAIFYLTECKNHTPTPMLCSWNYFIFIIISQESLEMLFLLGSC